jgi:hypothetical protein
MRIPFAMWTGLAVLIRSQPEALKNEPMRSSISRYAILQKARSNVPFYK